MNYGGSWHCTGDRDQDHPQEKEMQKSKMDVWGGLTNSCEKKGSEKQGEKKRYAHLNAEFQRTARRDEKAFPSDQWKEIEENISPWGFKELDMTELSNRCVETTGTNVCKARN